MSGLTPKQEAFSLAYIETGNASEAYRQAYNAENMKPETVNRNAKALLDNNKIATRVEELQAEHQERHNITVDGLTDGLQKVHDASYEAGQFTVARESLMNQARLHGLLVDKRELSGPNGGPIAIDDMKRLKNMNPEERKARIEELLEKRDV
jgi:phage terminase small subunit